MLNCVFLQPHESTLKSNQTRRTFEKRLLKNIKSALGKRTIKKIFGSFILNSKAPEKDAEKLKYVFGLSKISPAVQCNTAVPEILKILDFLIKKTHLTSKKSFGVRAKCINSPLKSREVEREFGEYIQDKTSARVDLSNTENWFFINLLEEKAVIYTKKISGFGGLPVGVSGKCLAKIDSSKESLLAAWMLARRGCEIDFLIEKTNKNLPELQKFLLGYKPLRVKTPKKEHDAIITKTPIKSDKINFTPLIGLEKTKINSYFQKLNF